MLSNRKLRLMMLLLSVLALFGTVAPRAEAAAAIGGVIAFQGTASLTTGLSYPCIAPGPTTSVPKCPIPTVNGTGAGCPGGVTTHPVCVTGANTAGVTFGSGPCVGAGVGASGGPPVNVEVGVDVNTCSITAGGSVTGSCGLSSGLVNYSIDTTKTTITIPDGTITNTTLLRTGRVHWIAVGGTLVVTGNVDGFAASAVAGVVQATPIPTTTLPGTTIGNSCSNKTATQFQVQGVIGFVGVTP